MKKKNVSGKKFVKFAVYLVVVVLMNLAGATLFFRIDLTENGMYSISDFSKKVVSTLSEPLTINVFFTKNLPAPYNNVEQYLHDLMDEYSIHAGKFFNYRFYNVSPQEGGVAVDARQNRELADNYGIYPVQIRNIEKDQVKFQKAYMGLVMIHGDLVERIQTITSTDGLEYKITTTIRKLNNKISALLSLEGKIKVKLYLSSTLKAVAPYMGLKDLPQLPEKFQGIVDELNKKNYGKLEFEYLDPKTDQERKDATKRYNVMSLEWPALSKGSIPAGKGVIGMVVEYEKKFLEIPVLNVMRIPMLGTRYDLIDTGSLKETLNDNLELLIDINESLGYLADHGTPPVNGTGRMGAQDPGTLSNFRALVSQNYTIKEVNLKSEGIPSGINTLVIAGPKTEFTDYELFQIDQALMRGKNLAIFLDQFREAAPQNQQQFSFNQQPTYIPLDTGIEKLLKHYGISMKKSYVMDESSYKQQVPMQYGGGERTLYFAPVIKNKNINSRIGFMKNIKGLITVKVSPLEPDEKRISENGLEGHTLFSSSEKSWEMSGRIDLNPMFIRPPESDEKKQSFPLAYLLEGEFPSYFAGKPIPEKTGDEDDSENSENIGEKRDLSKIEGKGELITKGKPAKIFLIASSEVLKNNMLDVEGKSTNATFIQNVLDALNNREGIARMRSKEQRFNPLDDITAGTKIFVKSFGIGGLPLLAALFGTAIWTGRKLRRKRIQAMFQKQGGTS
ncbi:MAG: hypothetical protein IEMM0002_0184 [bacterium]|nr:MAG: hypothetical protein IEMM0002_0184 [bacterium]